MSILEKPFPDHVTSNTADQALVSINKVSKNFDTRNRSFLALDNINLTISRGEYVAIVGRSGSGKSTLMNMISGIDKPSAGEIFVDGKAIHKLDETQLAIWRGMNVGVVFQFFQLLPTLTILENVMLPMEFCHAWPANKQQERALELLDQVGIADQAHKFPGTMSGGQQQRAAIARALANDPDILVADEPTGNLDSRTADAVLGLFADLSKQGKTLILVTHERDAVDFVERIITLEDGKVI